jgi:hypothetical protein
VIHAAPWSFGSMSDEVSVKLSIVMACPAIHVLQQFAASLVMIWIASLCSQ